jgi:hypothetical protein
MTNAGSFDTLNTAIGGFAIGMGHFLNTIDVTWTGLERQFIEFRDTNKGGTGAHLTLTDGSGLYLGAATGQPLGGFAGEPWYAASFADGGGDEVPPDPPDPPGPSTVISRIGNAVFFRLGSTPPLRIWCGINDIGIGIDDVDVAGSTYLGAGQLLNVPDLEVLINGIADRIHFFLPGVTVDAANKVAAEAPEVLGLDVHVGIALINDRYQPVTQITPVWQGKADMWSMRQDPIANPTEAVTRTLVLSVGTGPTGRSRPRRTTYSTAQQKLVYPTDDFCNRVTRYTRQYEVKWPIY